MTTDSEHINIQFHNNAKEIFFVLYDDFLQATQTVDRTKNEFEYQQIFKQHSAQLKLSLEQVARELLEGQSENRSIRQINLNLNSFIKEYLNLFVQKINKF